MKLKMMFLIGNNWINQCKCWGFDLVNHTLGGENGCAGIYNLRGNAKLTKEQIVEIYQSIDSIDNLIIKYNVSKSTIRGIKNGSIWNIYTNHKKQPKKHQKLTNEIKQHIKNIRLNGEEFVIYKNYILTYLKVQYNLL